MRELGATSAGVWTRRQALAVLTPAEVATRLRRQEWQTVWPGTYADAGVVLDPLQRAAAASLASRGGVVCGRTAARVLDLPLVDDDDPATGRRDVGRDDVVVVQHGRPLRSPDGRVLRRYEHALDVADHLPVEPGVRVTTPARTLFDLAALLRPDALVCAVDDALHRRLVPPGRLAEEVERRRGSPGSVAFRCAVELADGRAESPAETLTRLLLRPLLPGLVPQVVVHGRGGRPVARVDLGDERLRLAVEADGRRGHAGELMVAKDRRRDALLHSLGWTTERVTWFELRRRPDDVRRRVAATAHRLAARSA